MRALLEKYIADLTDQVVSEKTRHLDSNALKFNFEEFKKLAETGSFEKLYKYTNDRLQNLSCGSSRCAYILSSGKVLKIAYMSSVYQNKGEKAAFDKFGPEYVPQVFAFAPNYMWLVVEPSRTFSSRQDMLSHTGVPEELLWFMASSKDKDIRQNIAGFNEKKAKDLARWQGEDPQGLTTQRNEDPGALSGVYSSFKPIVYDDLPEKGKELLEKFKFLTNAGMYDISRWDHWGWGVDQRIICIDPGLAGV